MKEFNNTNNAMMQPQIYTPDFLTLGRLEIYLELDNMKYCN